MAACPVTFDYAAPEMQTPRFWDSIAELQSYGPVVWVESKGGFWAVTSHELVLQVAQDWQTFTSAEGVALGRASFDEVPAIVPLELEPPRHRAYRRTVNPSLTVKALAGLEGRIRDIADELIDTFIDDRSCDVAVDFARKFPGTVFFRLIAHSTDEEFRAVEPWARIMSFESDDPARFAEAATQLRGWAERTLAARERQHVDEDDVVSAVQRLNQSSEIFADHEFMSGLQILAQGGIGTSSNLIGTIMLVLCRDQALQERLRADISGVPRLMEECLRMEPPAPLFFRTATRDVELGGRQVRKGDKICLVFAATGRDPAVFEHPDELDLDRPHYRHLSFGVGVHRCIGSNLARLQIRVAMEQLITRLSPFRLPDGAEVQYRSLMLRGPSSVPLEFAPAG